MHPKFWGNNLWYSIHILAMTYIPENKGYYAVFFNSLQHLISCLKCKKEFSRYLRRYPPNFNNLKQWTVDLHNNVNQRLKKKIYTNEEITNLYYDSSSKLKPINYIKFDYMISHFVSHSNNLEHCKRFFNTISYIHPSPIVRNKLTHVFKKTNLNNIKNIKQLQHWFIHTYMKLIVEYDNIQPGVFNF
jgi:hypothetical protein